MKLKIISKEQNPLMKRIEITFSVDHSQSGGTPTRVEVKEQLAKLLKTNLNLVYLKRLETKTGTMVAIAEANVYDSVEQARLLEPNHIIARNVMPERSKESQSPENSIDKEE